MKLNLQYWLKFSIFNLFIVGLLGVLMRYKIGFAFPLFEQHNIQHAHSHFAFTGWITHTLYVLMIGFLQDKNCLANIKKYKIILIANLFFAYGMLISFALQGYGTVSIIFSTSSIIVACLYAFYFLADLNKFDSNHPASPWFKAAIWFNIISSFGTFYLAYMMASHNFNETWYLASVYFYLHFQYNGFFIFTCMGLVYTKIRHVLPDFKENGLIFKLFFFSMIPAYFLSVLWADLPPWLYLIVVLSAITQVVAWILFLSKVKAALSQKMILSKYSIYLFIFVALAFTIKLMLQLGSTIPVVSTLAFGFRPIVIAYLHLVLLAVISVFLLTYLHTFKLLAENKTGKLGLTIFAVGVFLNELVLAIQGIASFSYIAFSNVNLILFVVSLILLSALILMVISQQRYNKVAVQQTLD